MTRGERGGSRVRARMGRALCRRSVLDWVRRLEAVVPGEWRAGVAAVVWWDFADLAEDRRMFTDLFEPWLVGSAGREVPGPVLEPWLRKLGYPAEVAAWRAAERRTVSMPRRGRGRPPGKKPWPVGEVAA